MTPLPDHQPSTKSTHVSKWQLLRQSSAAQVPTHRYPAAPKKVDLGVTAEGWRGCTIRCPPPRTITAHCVASLASPSNCAPHSAALASASVLACWCLRETQQQGQIAMVYTGSIRHRFGVSARLTTNIGGLKPTYGCNVGKEKQRKGLEMMMR